jgi:hypothetical protein
MQGSAEGGAAFFALSRKSAPLHEMCYRDGEFLLLAILPMNTREFHLVSLISTL